MGKFIKFASLAIVLFAVANAAHAGVMVLGGHHHHRDFDDEIDFHVPAVPEAGTLPLMAVGLGLIGLRLRRKTK